MFTCKRLRHANIRTFPGGDASIAKQSPSFLRRRWSTWNAANSATGLRPYHRPGRICFVAVCSRNLVTHRILCGFRSCGRTRKHRQKKVRGLNKEVFRGFCLRLQTMDLAQLVVALAAVAVTALSLTESDSDLFGGTKLMPGGEYFSNWTCIFDLNSVIFEPSLLSELRCSRIDPGGV